MFVICLLYCVLQMMIDLLSSLPLPFLTFHHPSTTIITTTTTTTTKIYISFQQWKKYFKERYPSLHIACVASRTAFVNPLSFEGSNQQTKLLLFFFFYFFFFRSLIFFIFFFFTDTNINKQNIHTYIHT